MNVDSKIASSYISSYGLGAYQRDGTTPRGLKAFPMIWLISSAFWTGADR